MAMQHSQKIKGSQAEALQAAQKCGETDDPLEILLYGGISIRMTHGFIKLGFSANAVTFLSLFFGIAGGALFYPSNIWLNLLGMVLVITAAIFDCCDGQVARLTGTSSQLGRVLDGLADIINYAAIYIALGFRMMQENIPFTQSPWSFYIWIVLVVTMLCHASQARMADYYKGVHLFFLKGSDTSALGRSKAIQAELAALPGDSPFFERFYRHFYLDYAKKQEKSTPRAQRLLDAVEAGGGVPAPDLAEDYLDQSRRYIQMTNILTYNVRTYILFAMLLLGMHPFYFLFVILVLEAVKYLMISRYERIAGEVYQRHFS